MIDPCELRGHRAFAAMFEGFPRASDRRGPDPLAVAIPAPNRSNTTAEAVAWVNAGGPIPSFPGWSRVLVTPTRDTARRLIDQFDVAPPLIWPVCHWMREGRHADPDVIVGVVDADIILRDAIRYGNLGFAALRGEAFR